MSIESSKEIALPQSSTLTNPRSAVFSWSMVAGMALNFIASQFFSLMHGSCKYLYNTSNITAWEIVYWRSLGLIFCNAFTAYFSGASIIGIPRKFGWILLWRVITGVLGMLLIFYQTKVMSFSKATTLFYTYPTFTMIFAYMILNERITKCDIISSIFSFFGVIAIVFDPSSSKKINDIEYEPTYAPLIPLLASVFCSATDVYTRALGKDVHYTVSPAFFGIGCAAFAPILMQMTFSAKNELTNYDANCIIYVIVVATSGFVGQMLLTQAFQIEKAGRLAVISYVQVVNACLIDIIIFKIPIYGYQYLGMFLIVSSGATLMILKGCELIT